MNVNIEQQNISIHNIVKSGIIESNQHLKNGVVQQKHHIKYIDKKY